MPSAKTYLEFSKGASHKFYEVTVELTRVTLRYGRIGTAGKTEETAFQSEAQAQSFAQSKIQDKLRKGYQYAEAGASGKKPIERPVLDDRGKFWRLIELSRKGSGGDVYAQLDNLRERLRKLPEAELRSFDQVLWGLMDDSYRADLWGAAYIINGGCSDDGFDYFRGWLILQGEKTFTEALKDPDSLAARARRALDEGGEFECEDALGIAAESYQMKTGREDFYLGQPGRKGAGLVGDLEAWSDVDTTQENARRLYPRLCQLFLNG
jgi:predicted DNA-binding WGR domain protein